MPNKIKFIIIGLVAILGISLIINLTLFSSNSFLQREKSKLEEHGLKLQKKSDEDRRNAKQLEDKVGSLTRDLEKTLSELDKISKEKVDAQRRYEVVSKERDALSEKAKVAPFRVIEEEQQQKEVALPPVFNPSTENTYWAGVLKAKANLELQLEGLRDELKIVKMTNEKLVREKSNLGYEIKNINRQSEELRRQMDYNQKIADTLTQELVREKDDKFQIQTELKILKNENNNLRRQLEGISSRKSTLEEKIIDLQEKNRDLEDNLNKMETFLKDKMLQVDELRMQFERKEDLPRADTQAQKRESGRDSVDLSPIIVRPQSSQAKDTASGQGQNLQETKSRVVSINRENNFVIISQGEAAGVRVGDSFGIYRDGKVIANIEVIKTRQNIAACDIKKETTPIAVGDVVK